MKSPSQISSQQPNNECGSPSQLSRSHNFALSGSPSHHIHHQNHHLHQPVLHTQTSSPQTSMIRNSGSPISYQSHTLRGGSPSQLNVTSTIPSSSPLRMSSPIPQMIIKKEVQMVEDVSRVHNLESQLRMSQMQNRCFAAELESLQKKPPLIQEKIQFVEDTRKLDLLNSQFAEVIAELERETQHAASKDEQNAFLRQRIAQLEQHLRTSEHDNAKLRLQSRDTHEELASFKTSNALLIQQNAISAGQIDSLNSTVTQCLADISAKNETIEEKNKQIGRNDKSLWELREIVNLQEQSICSKESEILNLQSAGDRDRKIIMDNEKCIAEEQQVIDNLQCSLKSLQETMSRQEALIHNQANVIQSQISEIDALNARIEAEKAETARVETSNKCLNVQIELLLKKQEDLQFEVEHLQSHEERLAVLHREIEVEKIAMLSKIKENDRLMSYISKLEKQIKKFHSSSSTNSSNNNNNYRSISPHDHSPDEASKRAKLAAIAHADNLKQNQSLYSSRYSATSATSPAGEKEFIEGSNERNHQQPNYTTSNFAEFAK